MENEETELNFKVVWITILSQLNLTEKQLAYLTGYLDSQYSVFEKCENPFMLKVIDFISQNEHIKKQNIGDIEVKDYNNDIQKR